MSGKRHRTAFAKAAVYVLGSRVPSSQFKSVIAGHPSLGGILHPKFSENYTQAHLGKDLRFFQFRCSMEAWEPASVRILAAGGGAWIRGPLHWTARPELANRRRSGNQRCWLRSLALERLHQEVHRPDLRLDNLLRNGQLRLTPKYPKPLNRVTCRPRSANCRKNSVMYSNMRELRGFSRIKWPSIHKDTSMSR